MASLRSSRQGAFAFFMQCPVGCLPARFEAPFNVGREPLIPSFVSGYVSMCCPLPGGLSYAISCTEGSHMGALLLQDKL